MSVFISFISVSGCHAMKSYPPENFFHGTQLTLAQNIFDGDLNAVVENAKKIDLNKPGKEDMTMLFYAFQAASDRKEIRFKIMSQLVRFGADPLQRVPDMGSVAGAAAHADSHLYMQSLIDGGMDPNTQIRDTPLIMMAADDDTIPTMNLLIEKGADVNKRDSLGATALMTALDGLQLDAVSWLLDNGADSRLTETNTGWSFSRQLFSIKKKIGGDKKVDVKLQEIIEKCVKQGMEWPPTQK